MKKKVNIVWIFNIHSQASQNKEHYLQISNPEIKHVSNIVRMVLHYKRSHSNCNLHFSVIYDQN